MVLNQADAEDLGTDQVDDDLDDDLQHLLEIEGRVQLVAGDVEVGEVVVLVLDLDVAAREVFVLGFDLGEASDELLPLLLEPAHLLHQLLDEGAVA